MSLVNSISGYPEYTDTNAIQYSNLVSFISNQVSLLGFQPVVLPSVARSSLFTRSVGEVSDIATKEMTCLAKDGLCMRPEGTALAMSAWFNRSGSRNSVKWFYAGSMYRSERPQEGRLREFRQFGLEGICIPFGVFDAEMVSVCTDIFKQLGITVTLKVNTVGNIQERTLYATALQAYMVPYRGLLSELEISRLDTSPLRLLDTPSVELEAVLTNAPKLNEFFSAETVSQYALFLADLDILNVEYVQDITLVRGLDYYAGPVYEWQASLPGGRVVAIAAGGRYDGLARLLTGSDVPAVGMAFGLDRMMLLLDDVKQVRSGNQSCWQSDDGRKAALLWSKNKRMSGEVAWTDNSGGKWNKQMSRADKLNSKQAVFFGESELIAGVPSVKDLDTGVQT